MMMGDANPGWTLLTLLILVAVVLAVTWTLTGAAGPTDAPGQILDERLARGDITPEQYQELRATLTRTRPAPPRTPRRALLVTTTIALVALALLGATAGTGGQHWPGWIRSMHDGMWGTRGNVGGQAPPPVPGAREIKVIAAEFFFEPTDLRVRSGETVNIALDNRGGVFHDLHIEDLDFELEANRGGQDTGAFTAPNRPGRYEIMCHVPGHAVAGMRATLTVEPTAR